jgi:phage-related protein
MIGNMFKGSKAGQGITSYLGAVGGQLGNLKSNPIVSGIGGALGQAGGFVGSGFKGLGQGFGMLGQYIGGAVASSKPGQFIGGALSKIGSVGSAAISGISSVGGAVGGALAGPLGAIGNLGGGILGTLTTAAGPITGIFSSIISGALPIVGIISSIIAVVSILGDNLDGIRGIVQNVFGDQGVAIFDTFIGKIQEIGTFIQGLFGTGLIELMAPLKESITNMFGEDAGAAFGGITEILQSVMNVIQQIVDFSITYVKPIIEEVINFIVQDALPIVLQTISAAAPFISQIITTIGSMIMRVAQVIAQAIQFAWPFIQQILTAVLQFAQGAIPKLLEAVNVVATNVGGYINAIIGVFTNLIDFIGNVFTGNWEAAWENVKAIFSNAFDALVELAKIPINAVIGIINGAIAGINSIVGGGITIPEWVPVIGGGTWSLQLPEIPYLAKGGFTNGPSIAGEAGTEAVISFASGVRNQNIATWAQAGQMLGIDALERPSEVSLADIGDYGVSSGGAVTFSPQITINGNADDAVMDRAILKMQSEFETWYRNMKRREARTRY